MPEFGQIGQLLAEKTCGKDLPIMIFYSPYVVRKQISKQNIS